MPKVLRGSVSGTTANDGAILLAMRDNNASMWALSDLGGWTRDKVLDALMDRSVGSKDEAIQRVLDEEPRLVIDGARKLRCIEETGYDSWYDWCIDNWGTKWNSYNVKMQRIDDATLEVKMETAWSFPLLIMRAISEKFPSLTFDCLCFDEGWNFAGRGSFHGGPYTWEEVEATAELYERVYGEPYVEDDED